MHVGLSVFFQNRREGQSDAEVYDRELALADQAELLGFTEPSSFTSRFFRVGPRPGTSSSADLVIRFSRSLRW